MTQSYKKEHMSFCGSKRHTIVGGSSTDNEVSNTHKGEKQLTNVEKISVMDSKHFFSIQARFYTFT